jgi:hypothetical protein
MRVKMTIAVLALAALALSVPASSFANGSRTVHVDAGESIQAAIDEARPYTTIKIAAGTYNEALHIDKDGIKLVGEGRKKTHIAPAAEPRECVFAPTGICVADVDADPHVVKDVHISHLSANGFDGFGIFYFGTKDGVITRVIASDNAGYGMFVLRSSGTTIARNVTANDGEAGIYVGGSPDADATVWKNVSYGNLFGIFIRDAAHGEVLKNKTFSNCLGILFLNTDETAGPEPEAAIDVKDWLAKHNSVTANNKVCEGEVSGIGIAVLGGVDIHLIDNGVFGNVPPEGALFGGGIAVMSSPEFAPPKPSTGTKVGFNTVLGNEPDLFWDEQPSGGGGNRFFANDCLTSQPDGLCEDPDHTGDGEHGDDGGHRGDDHNKGDRDDHKRKHAKHKKPRSKKHKSKKHKKHKKHDRDDD